MYTRFLSALALFSSSSVVTYAQSGAAETEVKRVVGIFQTILDFFEVFVAIAVTLAFIFFFWGIAEFINSRGKDGGKAQEAKNKLFWSVVAIFVLTSVWGIVFFLFRVFIGDVGDTKGSRAVGDGVPIESLRLPIDRDSGTAGGDLDPVNPPGGETDTTRTGGETDTTRTGGETDTTRTGGETDTGSGGYLPAVPFSGVPTVRGDFHVLRARDGSGNETEFLLVDRLSDIRPNTSVPTGGVIETGGAVLSPNTCYTFQAKRCIEEDCRGKRFLIYRVAANNGVDNCR